MAKSKNNNINISIFTALKVSEVSGVPTLLMGNPGLGKTSTVYMFCKVRGYELVLLRGNSESAESVAGYDTCPKDVTYEKPMAAVHLRPSWFERVLRHHSEGKKTLLLIDELGTANEFVQAALLHLIFERMCGTEKLPDDTLIVSASNYSGNLSSTMNILSPVLNRFMIFNIIPDQTDLDIFMNRFDGSLSNEDGKPNDYMGELLETMKKIDKQEVKIPEEQYNKIGYYIESNIRETTKMLMTSQKLIDMRVTDMTSLYQSTTDDDSKLYNFVTFRSLNYLRDVTLACYICFGKDGMSSDNYMNMIEGLCGVGLTREAKSGDVKVNKIASHYYTNMQTAINEIEKLKNSDLPKYEKFFVDITKGTDKKSKKKSFSPEEVNALINKLTEMYNDPALKTIERPVDISVINEIFGIIKTTSTELFPQRFTAGEDLSSKIAPEGMAGIITRWNAITDFVEAIGKIIKTPRFGYKEDATSSLSGLTDALRTSGFKLNSFVKIYTFKNQEIASLLPPLNKLG